MDSISEIEKKIINASKLLGKILKPRRKLNVIIPATFNKLQAKYSNPYNNRNFPESDIMSPFICELNKL